MRNKLLELDYNKIFSPKTLSLLKGKSKENLKKALGGRNRMELFQNIVRLSQEVAEAETGYTDELEMLAVQIAKDAYPIIELANIRIDAKIVPKGEVSSLDQDDDDDESMEHESPEEVKAKRRIINSITQGGALRGGEVFLLFREYIDEIDPTLIQKYLDLQRENDSLLDDEDWIALMMAMLANRNYGGQAGEEEIDYDENEDQFVIKARAINFPVLVHEIIKGLYEIIGTGGSKGTPQQVKAAHKAVDKPEHEPEDMQIGRFVYDAVNKIYIDSKIDNAAVRDYFLGELYELDEKSFVEFIENAINNKLTPVQKRWAEKTMKSIEDDIK